jgi:hypothetical protein
MKSKRSRLARVGVLALALSVTVGLATGSVAEAKKKKGAKSVTVSRTVPTGIPAAAAGAGAPNGVALIPLAVGGKKVKGKVVGWDTLTITTNWTSTTAGALNSINAELIAPNGRTVNLVAPPFDTGAGYLAAGPVTETPNSKVGFCSQMGAPPPPPCSNVDNTLGRPYAGTVGNTFLAWFGGVPVTGTWTLEVQNSSATTTATLNSVTLFATLRSAPV